MHPAARALPDPVEIDRELARRHLLSYATYQWSGYRIGQHHALIAEYLEAVERGEIRRLQIWAPPRHGKSLLTSQYFPAWYLGRHQERFVITASYNQELAQDFGRAVRDLLQDPRHAAAFPGCQLRSDSQSAVRLQTTRGGKYFAVGVGGSATGRGAHLFVIDDPVKNRAEAESAASRAAIKAWYGPVARTRLQKGGAIVLMMTRWHEDDLAGWLLQEHGHEDWEVLNLPAEAEPDDPLGRQEGEPLWPDEFSAEELASIKLALGSYDYAALYQQRPRPAGGGMVKLGWFQRYDKAPAEFLRVIQSWDTAYKPEQINDPSVCTTWGETETAFYLLHVLRDRLEFPDLKRMAISLAERFKPKAILIEDAASGMSLIQELRSCTRLPIIALPPESSKVVRMQGCTPVIEAQRVYLPQVAEWLPDYEHELTHFPAAVHDDQADSTSQYLNWTTGGSNVGQILDALRALRPVQQRLQESPMFKSRFGPGGPSRFGPGRGRGGR